jgi:outer membrane protein OmpU
MKKVLLGSTALVAAGLIAGHAEAADGVKLSLGGYYRGVAGVMFDDFDGAAAGTEDDLRDYVFKQDVEVHFKGETTLDNGLTVGAVVQLEGQTSGDQIDEVYAYFSGGWGELRFGDDDEALTQLCSIGPSGAANFGADSPFFSFSNSAANNPAGGTGALAYAGTNGTCYGMTGDSTKLIYFSPNFGGFSFAMSFSPDDTEDTRNTVSGAGTRFENNAGQDSDALSLAANFNHDFNGVTLNIGGGATWSFDREGAAGADEKQDYQGYASVGFFGFTIGGSVEQRTDFGADNSDRLVYGAGVTYNWDAWTVGIGWTHGDYEIAQAGATVTAGGVTATLTGDANQNQDIFALTAAYALGPGITVDGVVEWVDSDTNAQALSNEYQGISFGLGTLISF